MINIIGLRVDEKREVISVPKQEVIINLDGFTTIASPITTSFLFLRH